MVKKVMFGDDSRVAMFEGVKKMSDAVRVTMGASGKCVLVGNAIYGDDGLVHLPTIVSKDGVTITRNVKLEDSVEHRGAMLIREAAEKTVYEAGDATTATVVLAAAFIEEGMKLIKEGGSSIKIKKDIDDGVSRVVDKLKAMSTPVRGDIERVRQVATVSANNDKYIGDLIAEAFSKIGFDGVIDIEKSAGIETVIKVSDGLKFDRGWVSPLFVNVPAKETCEFENPLILLYDKKVTHHTQIQKAVELSVQSGNPLLVICEDAEAEGLAFLAMNNYQKRIQVCVVKAPEFGEARREYMEDLSLLVGANYISDIRGNDIKKVKAEDFGSAKKVVVSKSETVIVEGKGNHSEIEDLVNDLKMNLTQAKTEDEKSVIEKRIARLTGGIAVIQVGAVTETELHEKLDRVDDAVRATKSAISEGFVPGGGAAFVKCFMEAGEHFDINKVLAYPIKQICENAGVEGIDSIIKQVVEKGGNYGYNVLSDNVEDLVEAGIIDSTKAIRCALVNAASVAGMFLTSECSIITTH